MGNSLDWCSVLYVHVLILFLATFLNVQFRWYVLFMALHDLLNSSSAFSFAMASFYVLGFFLLSGVLISLCACLTFLYDFNCYLKYMSTFVILKSFCHCVGHSGHISSLLSFLYGK